MSRWYDVCRLDEILPLTGVCALVAGRQIAVFRLEGTDELFALSNFDPFSKAFVLSRGIVGDRGGVPKVSSPVYKQSFDLRTGRCLDDPEVSVRSFPVRLRDGRVEILAPERTAASVSASDPGRARAPASASI
jgi:nitrite reductase (NADH) small subunit